MFFLKTREGDITLHCLSVDGGILIYRCHNKKCRALAAGRMMRFTIVELHVLPKL